MIATFADRETEALFRGERVRRLDPRLHTPARRKLLMIHAAVRLDDLRVPPGNRLEALRGDLAGLHSVRVNDQWRIIFKWLNDQAHAVRIVDYH